ncbi:THO complex subunit 5 homolog isoform X1 [Chanodichthys erythropterus]|uniref:THO complex subunit 5 homolog isoform X1 n=2 Tax=Chanodichthys erythropterus TaxID=933992 RepID=UPI00351EB7BC
MISSDLFDISVMSSDAVKKRKPKVIRSEGGTPEAKRGRGESDQLSAVSSHVKFRKVRLRQVKVTTPAGPRLIGQRKLFTAKNQEVRVYNEEVELEGRDPQQDYMLYKDTCAALAKLMAEIQELKAGGAKDGNVEIEERRRQSSVHFITLKKLNRLAHMRLKKGRDQTHEAKQRVDVLHLQLQNLLYEVMHLQKEIGKCLEFKSQHEEIELVSEEEFFQEAPAEISRPHVTRDDQHQLTLARLDWELEQRKRLAEQYKTSLASKEKIQRAIEQKREYLSSLQPGLQNIMQASLPVQEYLSMPFEHMQKQAEVARHLPPPLYVLLVQVGAYGQACDKNLSVSISGDVDEAKALSRPPDDSQDDESDSDAEEEQQNTKRRRATVGAQLDDKRKGMLRRHPLSLCVDLKCKDGSVLHLFFYYLMNLNILTVKTKVSTSADLSGAVSAGELLNTESLLNCLYASDHGKETPNPSNRYQFDKVGITTFADYVSDLGHPYVWVQKLGGLQFSSDGSQSGLRGSALSASHMERTIKLLRGRLQARLSLHKQFSSLEHSIIPVSSECQHLFPAKVISGLTRWTMMSHQEFTELGFVQHVLKAGLVHETDLFFMAVVERGTARLMAAVVLNPRYPDVSPLFSLSLLWKGERSGRSDDNLRAIESEVNVFRSELQGPRPGLQLLTNQIQRLCVCLDVYLETESQVCDGSEGPKEFPREKMCLRTARGPSRLKPFKYNHPQGFFSHR